MNEGFSFLILKRVKIFLQYFLFLTILLFCCCSDNGSLSSSSSIGYLSYVDEGCSPDQGLAKINSEAIIDYKYLGNHLKINVFFTTLCASVFKDSVVIKGNSIDIFLANVSKFGAECICPYKETFNFIILKPGKFKVKFCYRHTGKIEYHVLADTTIYL